jgi:hypothetical protein
MYWLSRKTVANSGEEWLHLMATIVQTQLYSNYDRAVADFIHRLRFPPTPGEERPVLHVFATPERALAQVERKLRNRPDRANTAFPLPFLSVERLSEDFDMNRTSRATFRRMWQRETDRGTRFYSMPWPVPMNLTYQLTMWADQIQDINYLLVQFVGLFDNGKLIYLTVPHPFPLEQRIVATELAEIAKVPMVGEPEAERLVRRTMTFVVYGWVSREALEYGRVEKVITRFYDSPDLIQDGDLIGETETTEPA